MLADSKFFFKLKFVCEEEGSKSSQGDVLFLLRDPLKIAQAVSQCPNVEPGTRREIRDGFIIKCLLKKKVRGHKTVATKISTVTSIYGLWFWPHCL